MKVPELDRSIGMEVYSTGIEGIGGRIKQSADQFVVEEMLDIHDVVEIADDLHAYPLYMLRKNGIDSTHALREIETVTGLRLKIAGLKDARALTTQYASLNRKMAAVKTKIATKHCSLELIGYTAKPLTKRRLVGNSFRIVISDFHHEKLVALDECTENVANFYGYQRFGSSRPVTHLVGREIVRRNFREAVNIFLSYTAHENEERQEIGEMCKEYRFEDLLKMMPPEMDFETMLVMEMLRSNDAIKALRALPLTIRRLFVQAYQSYIFNRTLSIVLKDGYDIHAPKERDICFSLENGNMKIGRFDGREKRYPAIPIAGYSFRDDNRFSAIAKKVMQDECVSVKDFYIKEMQEVSVEGGFRQAAMLCSEFSYTHNELLEVRFVLQKGSYATVLLRELMKPEDPIAAGF